MKVLNHLLELIYPTRCTFCHRLTQDGVKVCPNCKNALPLTKGLAEQRFSHIKCCCSPLFYEGNVRRSLLRYKFGGVKLYAEVYGEFLSKCIDENHISCDSITWVPLSRRRLRQRGYDQARLLAEELSRRQGIPCDPLLLKTRNTRRQSSLDGAEIRRRNVKGAYAALPGADIRGKQILLVDDIVTTGATLSECARTLKDAGAGEVYAVTVARRKN